MATSVLREFSKKGYIIDKKRMKNGTFFDEDYYEELLAEIREDGCRKSRWAIIT